FETLSRAVRMITGAANPRSRHSRRPHTPSITGRRVARRTRSMSEMVDRMDCAPAPPTASSAVYSAPPRALTRTARIRSSSSTTRIFVMPPSFSASGVSHVPGCPGVWHHHVSSVRRIGGYRDERDDDAERGAASTGVERERATTMGARDRGDDRELYTSAAPAVPKMPARGVQPLEDALLLHGRDAGPVVAHPPEQSTGAALAVG